MPRSRALALVHSWIPTLVRVVGRVPVVVVRGTARSRGLQRTHARGAEESGLAEGGAEHRVSAPEWCATSLEW